LTTWFPRGKLNEHHTQKGARDRQSGFGDREKCNDVYDTIKTVSGSIEELVMGFMK